eukprot:50595-Chlamydomonas_euryale.AAC.1
MSAAIESLILLSSSECGTRWWHVNVQGALPADRVCRRCLPWTRQAQLARAHQADVAEHTPQSGLAPERQGPGCYEAPPRGLWCKCVGGGLRSPCKDVGISSTEVGM